VTLKTSSEGLFSSPMVVPGADVARRCRLPSQAAFESHSSILRHASDVTRPVCASFLQRKCTNFYQVRLGSACQTKPSSWHEMFPGRVRHLLVRREIYADLHRCACQCPRSGMTMFFPGQKPVPDGHGVHSLPPPPRMYVPSWQGRHWPARRVVLVERLGITCHDRPGLCAFANKAQQIALAPFSLTKPRQVLSQRKNCK